MMLGYALSRGWTVQAKDSGSGTWHLEANERIIGIHREKIRDTSLGGNSPGDTYASTKAVAERLMAALRQIWTNDHPDRSAQLKLDLLFKEKDFVHQSTAGQWYTMFQGFLMTSFIGSGIEKVENAWVGSTTLGEKLGTWDRVKLATIGSVETLLLAVPAAKGITAIGGKLGASALVSTSVARVMTADLLGGFGEAALERIASTTAGKAFLKAYARVYDSPINIALAGEKKNLGALLDSMTAASSREVIAADATEYAARRVVVAQGAKAEYEAAKTIRIIQKGEKVKDLLHECAQLTFESGNEHGIVSLLSGERHLVVGGADGINLSETFGDQLRRVILHTHPKPSGPSAVDFTMLESLEQKSSWIYELFGGGLTKYWRK